MTNLLDNVGPAPLDLRVMRPDAIGRRVYGKLLEEPGSVHVVTGQIGVGKTTILYDVRGRLLDSGIAYAIYFDYFDFAVGDAKRPLLHAVTEALAADLGADDHATSSLPELRAAAARRTSSGQCVSVSVLIDGMGHCPLSQLKYDLWALQRNGIGAVVTRSLHEAYEHGLAVPLGISQWSVSAMRVARPEDVEFLLEILEARDPESRIDDVAARILVENSAGLPRDLVSLLKAAHGEAHRHGSDRITEAHAEAAVVTMGKGLLAGLDDEHRERLALVSRLGAIQPMSRETDRRLLASRCLVEMPSDSGRPVHVLHPAIRVVSP